MKLTILSLLCLLCIPLSGPASVIDLGDSQGFNTTIFGNFSATGGDTEGRLAIQGSATLPGGYSIGGAYVGIQLPQSNGTRDDLVIAGNVTVSGYVSVDYGNTKVGGTFSTVSGVGTIGTDGTNTVSYSVPNFAANVFDFAATESLIHSHSTSFAGMTANGTLTEVTPTLLRLSGTSPGINVFNISATDWNGDGIDHEFHVPLGATTIVNITGSTISVVNGGTFFVQETSPGTFERVDAAPYRQKLVYNAFEATSVTSTSFLWEGAFFATDAHFVGSNGAINGQAFLGSAANLGGFEFHNFSLNIPPTVIPEAGTILLALIPFATLWIFRRRRRA